MPSNQLLGSKIVFEEVPPGGRAVPKFNTCVVAFEGVCEKGPIGVSTLVMGFDGFKKVFGGYIADSDLATCIEGFFATGGVLCWVTRTVHYTDITDPTSKTSDSASATLSTTANAATAGSVTCSNSGPYRLANAETLVVVIDVLGQVTATFSAAAALVTSGNAAGSGYQLADGNTLTVKIDGGAVQTVTFHTSNFVDITAATAAEVVAVLAASLSGARVSVSTDHVRITSDLLGTDSSVEVTGGSANTALGFSTNEVSGTGNVANVGAVTAAEVGSLLEAALGATATVSFVGATVKITSATTGASSRVQVTSASTATAIGFNNASHYGQASGALETLLVEGKYDGGYANAYSVQKGAASSGVTGQFNLYVLVTATGIRKETWPNLSMDPTSQRYIETVINDPKTGSEYIKVTDLAAATTDVLAVPATGTTSLTGGLDGLAGIADSDFTGSQAGWTGLYAFDTVDSLTVLAIPGVATPAVHLAMVAYCETHRAGQLFPVLDPPANLSAAEIITYISTTAGLENLSEYGAIYWPRIKVANPSKSVYGATGDDGLGNIVIPPSGDICGVIARTDNAREGGVWDQPAGTETGKFARVLGFETDEVLSEDVRDLVFPHRINPLTTGEGLPRYIDGARTLKGDGNFPSVGQRRGVSFTERSIKAALQPMRHKNNNAENRAVVQRTVAGFLKNQCDLGAFASRIPDEAYFVDFGDALQVSLNVIDGMFGLATTQPAEFIRMRVSQDTRAATST